MRIILPLILSCFIVVKPTLGYVYGYNRLYNAATKTTIDLIFDVHFFEHNLTQEDMETLPVDMIKPKLYSSEQRFIEALEHLDESSQPGEIAFIGESRSNHSYGFPYFINHLERLIAENISSISYIHADRWREDTCGLIDFLMLGK